MWQNYINATSIDEVIKNFREKKERARIVAGGTDLILGLERGVKKGIDTLIDVSRIPTLDQIIIDEDNIIHLGPLVTHNDCAASKLIRKSAYPLARAAWEVGAPQIRNRGTIAGNLITASPANDTITPLMALGASVTLLSTRGERTVPLNEFYTGVRRSVMQADEMLVDISFPAMKKSQRGTFIKLALRRAQAISLVNVAIILNLKEGTVKSAVITLGAVTPVIGHAEEAEKFLAQKKLNRKNIAQAAELAMQAAHPIDDVRGSAAYRLEMVKVITARALTTILNETEQDGMPKKPVLLQSKETTEHELRPRVTFHPRQLKRPLMERTIPSPADIIKHCCVCCAKKAC
ncbi:MAG: xanthine dehydrogenase family protein subunit M [Anaerolineales bacterium]|uniref:FAD binding domain-containing protein n=1 Tax=Candidatus Villigracilis proximus TaxID=3140683 RepID=UPI0031352849|nr:xanthine dehydrogenase family protein subunit M [Anaerolineales bacterium]